MPAAKKVAILLGGAAIVGGGAVSAYLYLGGSNKTALQAPRQVSDRTPDFECLWPTPAYTRVTSPLGWRPDPFGGPKPEWHDGIDIAAPVAASVVAVAEGTVVKAAKSGESGWMVRVKHADGFQSGYAHMAQGLGVQVGDEVFAGSLLGYVGTSGHETGPHTHLTIWDTDSARWKCCDPIAWLRAGGAAL